ncbi:MAG: apolipoprotein N-acyltransferase [Paracoccus sp.]|nr:apolipoprotein N-acyltransferase [Paracoccus sp. (in: a-proteobacteria)]
MRAARHPATWLPDLALGLIAALSLAPFSLWAATPLALAALLWRLVEAPPATVLWRALAAGFGWFALALFWITEPFLVDVARHGWMAPFALILMAAGGALFWALPAWAAARLSQGPVARTAAIAAALVLSDWLRGWIFTGFPWAQIGHGWIDTPVSQIAATTGALGLSLLTVTMAALPVSARAMGRKATLAGGLAVILLGAGCWAVGAARLAAPLPADRDLILRIVQPDATQSLKWDPEWSAVFLRRLLDLSAEPGRRDLVIWPETAVNFLLEEAAEVLPVLSQAADAPLVMGIQRREGSRFYNSLATILPGGTVAEVYDKFHLVPFGEYIPWGDALARFGIGAFAAQQGNSYSPGPGPVAMTLPGMPDFQPLICYEAIFPQHLRALDQRPGWLLQATNDAWFGTLSGPYQHLDQARLRAIETGLPLVRAANTGVSAVIDARGQIRDSLPLNTAGRIDAPLPGALPPTRWQAWGNAPVLTLIILILGASVRRRRSPSSS